MKLSVGAALTVTLLLAGSSSLFSQRRVSQTHKKGNEERHYKENRNHRNKDSHKGDYKCDNHHKNHGHYKHKHKKYDKHYKHHHKKHHKYHKYYGKPRYKEHYHYYPGYRYRNGDVYCGHHHPERVVVKRNRYYHHPHYGRVIVEFGAPPVVIRHRKGHYYYSSGYYYRYRPQIGYVVVESPRNECFRELPEGCRRIEAGGHVYFEYGDIYFEKDRRGFRLVARPAGININLNF